MCTAYPTCNQRNIIVVFLCYTSDLVPGADRKLWDMWKLKLVMNHFFEGAETGTTEYMLREAKAAHAFLEKMVGPPPE